MELQPELQHLDVRLPCAVVDDFDPGEAIPVFHDWVRRQPTDELLIDIADYRHVPGGPGIVLIGHEGDYSLEPNDGAGGAAVHYQRKTPHPGDDVRRLTQALGAALRAALDLAAAPTMRGRMHVGLDGLRLVINDRLLAPNTAETAAALLPRLEGGFRRVLGHEEFSLVWDSDPRHRFGVTLRCQRFLESEVVLLRLDASESTAA